MSAAHGTPLYATVVVKNHAGLQSVIRSEKLVIDHTPPGIENIHVQVIQGTDVAGNDSLAEDEILVKLNISWNAVDDESGIKMCFVSVGKLRYYKLRFIVSIYKTFCAARVLHLLNSWLKVLPITVNNFNNT